MARQVDALTQSAGQLMASHLFLVPDFQRRYAWRANEEVLDFWQDLRSALERDGDYFLGLVILTHEGSRMTIVDGQQRLVTLTLLAQALKVAADNGGRPLLSDRLRDTVLTGISFEAVEERVPRIKLSADDDSAEYEAVLSGASSMMPRGLLASAYAYLSDQVQRDLAAHGQARLSEWVRFITDGLQFAVFTHPTRAAAFRVFEVVNARGKGLTPAELIKAYLIGVGGERDDIHPSWQRLELLFRQADASSQLTSFVRHAFTLRHGHTLPSDLYDEIGANYTTPTKVRELLDYLEGKAPVYLQLIDPSSGVLGDDSAALAFSVLAHLNLRSVRPLFMAIQPLPDSGAAYDEALKLIVPRIVVGTFGTGSIESRFANAAQRVAQTGDWRGALEGLRDLVPAREDFEQKVLSRSLNKSVLQVIRSSVLQGSRLPSLEGSLHLIRPRYADWPGFDEAEFRQVGSTVGNTILLSVRRRPHSSNSPETAAEHFAPYVAEAEEVTTAEIRAWCFKHVQSWGARIAKRAGALWYEGA